MTAPAARAAGRPVPERVEGFGLYNFSVSEVHRPASIEELAAVLADCRARGGAPVYRGAGRSYGDAALNPDGPVVELSRLSAIRSLDAETGVVRAGAGLTLGELWKASIPLGLWPPVVTGTMHVSLGGAVALNVHGKNGWKRGTIGDHVLGVTVLRPDGRLEELRAGTPALGDVVGNGRPPDPIVDVALRLKRVRSGYLDVEGFATKNLAATLAQIDSAKDGWEYVVGWMDCWAAARGLGRGVVHVANEHVPAPGERTGFSVAEQLADIRTGPLPVPLLLLGLKLTARGPQMRLVNAAKFLSGRLAGRARYRQSLVAYSFLLDYLPGWNETYRPGGFIQYQLFVPKERAEEAFHRALVLQQEAEVVSSLAVVKRHRADASPRGYAPDGFSLALDFPVTRGRSETLIRLCRDLDRVLLETGGSAYRAKDCVGTVDRLAAARRGEAA
ncbi:MAG TPA: FAD-binding oxidoreductase [Thermoanaerobaculia bacterium]|nr:FAD-binding oxidoreductase [Thermoanaerobaculia bacterium]